MRRKLVPSYLICLFLAMISTSHSTEEAVNSSVVTYDKAYFTKFEVVTLLDMLSRIPGVQEILDKSRAEKESLARLGMTGGTRGFGSGGDQILIDGKRLAGKNNNIDDTLARINAANIEKIDLIRGAASGLDVQSQGFVINIILVKGASTSSTFWKLGGALNVGDEGGHDITLSHSGTKGRFDYSATLESKRTFRVQNRDQKFSYGQSDVIARHMTGRTPNRKDVHKLSGTLSYSFTDGALLRLNALYSPERQDDIENRTHTFLDESFGPSITVVDDTLSADGNRKLTEEWSNYTDPQKIELGGDYSRKLGSVGSLKTLFVFNKEQADINKSFSKGEGVSKFHYQQQDSVLDKSEMILRSSISRSITQSQSLEIGGEAALNKFNRSFMNSTRATIADDLLLKNNDDVKIQENRYEVFLNHNYTISSQVSLSSSLTTEFSKIAADNFFADGSVVHEEAKFTFFKPRMNFRYDINTQDQLRLTVERVVSQLDFNNFATSYNALTEIIDFGNTSIKPMRSWDFTAAFEHRFPNDSGSISLELFYKKYTDYIHKVDFTDYVDVIGNSISADQYLSLPTIEKTLVKADFTSKSGNVPSATTYGVKFKSSYRLGFIGLKDAVFSMSYDYEKSNLINPFNGEDIRFSYKPSTELKFTYRHDVTEFQLSYGGSVAFRRGFYAHDIRLIWPGTPGTLIEVFVEKYVYNGIKLRLSGRELGGQQGNSTQNIYNNHVRFNDLNRVIRRHTTGPRIIEVSLQGTF
ncbi:MAG: TonB-dependent receptor plug domain-containing protein [Emcibacteraceae bacterium]|nr:TonB-dependent receptor plug domain-containing protein [Emcibacteraceae bacterium]